ncbi:ATP-binding cassette domain-containing protein [Neisseria leonii]|uniref:ATP-binding cassette domain-containing protein n=1 Tax=Neisseria leonii TaxID=2995413 RepID=A0A9X4IDI7_9NEIS|nr:ATP-binding cassette domain-containing protein [Neisseria sp. 51.81]MDD9327252.1 ATP-binding cassette domain-containing protein [Neisseria sp. 51.81]
MMFDFRIQTEIRTRHAPFALNVQCRTPARRLAVVGPSGAGKSLMLQILAGLLRPQAAEIRIGGQVFADAQNWLPAPARRLGVVFQDYALFPHLTVAQNIAFGRRGGWRNPPRQPDAETAGWLDKMQLARVAQHYPHQISGGQKQRTALARACIIRPHCLLLDEPFSALDQTLRTQMREEIARLQRERDIPMLMVSHDAADIDCLADEVWQMDNGVLFQTA